MLMQEIIPEENVARKVSFSTKAMAVFIALLLLFLNGADGAYIVGGREAAPHSHPYMASLQFAGRHICGGALIREDFVLTAAHCRIRPRFTVVVGVDSLRADEPTRQERTAVRAIQHPDYDGQQNDIMLLKLNRRVQLNNAVQLITLRTGPVRPLSRCLTAGWGDIGDNNTLPDTLQEVNVTILSQRTCRQRWLGVRITQGMICGTGEQNIQGFCSGDSGGPLICNGASAGVVSFSGRICGNQRTPDVYTRISSFTDWITRVLDNN
ncbi:serine protease 57-like [Synchiropus splendidus]|uniref:serine protease 57-like n=1 Tax=Synchiropus splendidus TaxID=270530 RepID=UPI00237DA57E|nr:serine protease 57-like [Synchiropus splendidus]